MWLETHIRSDTHTQGVCVLIKVNNGEMTQTSSLNIIKFHECFRSDRRNFSGENNEISQHSCVCVFVKLMWMFNTIFTNNCDDHSALVLNTKTLKCSWWGHNPQSITLLINRCCINCSFLCLYVSLTEREQLTQSKHVHFSTQCSLYWQKYISVCFMFTVSLLM